MPIIPFEKLDIGTIFYSRQRAIVGIKISLEHSQELPFTWMMSYNSLRLTYKVLKTNGLAFITGFPDLDKITRLTDPICLTEFSDDSKVSPLSEIGFSFKEEENENGL